jgi:hypothetical protein
MRMDKSDLLIGSPARRLARTGAAMLVLLAAVSLAAEGTNDAVTNLIPSSAVTTNLVATNTVATPVAAPNAVPLYVKNLIVWLGPAMFFFFLGVFNLVQTFRSRSGLETAAKVLVNCLGFVLVFWIWSTFNIDHTRGIEAFVKSPPPQTASAQLWCGILSAAVMVGFLFALEALGDLTAGKNLLQALTIFVSCVAIYLLSPLITLLADTDHLVESRFYHLATGTVIGGVLYLIFLLFYLGTRKAKAKS